MHKKPDDIVIEYKSLARPHAIKAIEDRTVTTVFSVAQVLDSYGDKVMPGAFNKTIAERGDKVFHLWSHQFDQPAIGVVKALREIPRDQLPESVLRDYPEASGGAEAVTEILDTPRGNEILTGIKAGAPYGASFGYDALKYAFIEENGMNVRLLQEVRLHEVSTVLWGANPAAGLGKQILPIDELLKQLYIVADELKAGNRHSETDYKLIDTLHDVATKLGARTCKGILTDDDKSKTLQKLSALRPSNTRKRQEPVAITGLWLRALGNSIQACVEIDEEWRLAIDEMVVAEIEGIVSHICEPLGMRHAPLLDTGKSQSRAEPRSLTQIQMRHRQLTSALQLLGEL